MTNAELKAQLIADPSAAINYIVNNNPDAVMNNLRAQGFNIATWEDIGQALNELLDRKETQRFIAALSVPFLIENADPAEVLAVKDAVIALNARTPQTRAAQPPGGFDISALLGGLATGTIYYLNETGDSLDIKQDGSKPPTPPKSDEDKTWTYIAIGAAILAAIVVVVLIIRKKG